MFHIIDDQPALARVYSNLLSKIGFDSMVFTSPREYLDYAESAQFTMPTATFTNIEMPGMNGYEMMERIHHIRPGLRFVVATGIPEMIDHPYKTKACMYLRKPFHIDALKNTTSRLEACVARGPSDELGCEDCDSRKFFALPRWNCPHMEMLEA